MSRKLEFDSKWIPPTSREVEIVVSSLGGKSAVARILKKNRCTIHYWCSGKRKIDYANWRLIESINKG